MYFSADSVFLKAAAHRLVRLCLAGLAVAVVTTVPAHAHVYQYDVVATSAITNVSSDGNCDAGTGALNISFLVPDSFNATSIAVGLTIDHNLRGDIRAVLEAPDGTDRVLFDNSGDNDPDFDILLSTNSDAGEPGVAGLDDGNIDPVAAPFFNRPVTVAALGNGTPEAASGTWILHLCDRANAGTTGNHLRSRLILVDATAATRACATRLTYNWGANGDDADFTSTTVGGVTITETDIDYGGGRASGGVFPNQTTQTSSMGGETGFYVLYMDASAVGGSDAHENLGQSVTFSFSQRASDLEFRSLDSDQLDGDFEDIIRIFGNSGSGTGQRYQRTSVDAVPVFQVAGDTIEADSACAEASTCATEIYNFDRPVSALTYEYYAGDDVPVAPGDQWTGVSDFFFCTFDFGDAPDTGLGTSRYGTVLANNGARHVLGTRDLWLGVNRPDGDSDGSFTGNVATTDDQAIVGPPAFPDDEDGITAAFPVCPNNTTYSVNVTASDVRVAGANGAIRGFIDWSRDGDFLDAGETSAATSVPRTDADNTSYAITWSSVPANCGGTTSTFARFRFSTDLLAIASPLGLASDGEVEDYQISATTLPVTIARVETVPNGSSMTVRFTTATETGNAGFRIWGTVGQGKPVLLATLRSRGVDSFVPQSYEATVRGAGISSIRIEDVSLYGENRMHGPFAVGSTFGEEPEAARIDWAAVRSENGVVTALDRMRAAEAATGEVGIESLRATPAVSARGLLLVRDEGIHRVTHEQLLSAGIDLAGAPAARIALVDNGVGVPRYVEAAGGIFGPGSYIEFVARPQLTLASPVDVYVLTLNAHKAIAVSAMSQGSGGSGLASAVGRYRPDRTYSFSSPNSDPWFDARVLAWGSSATLSRDFDLPNLAAGAVQLKARLWGWGDFAGATPDHHVILKLNGTEIAQHRFDGLVAWEPEVNVSNLVTASGNTLEVLVPGDTGYAFDNIAFEGFEVAYTRATVARSERFQGTAPRMLAFTIDGFAAGEPVAVWKVAGNAMQRELRQPVRGSVVAAGGPGDVYAASQSALYSPGISSGVPAAQLKSTAEYLIVTHPSLADSTGDLVALEESRGFTTEVVTSDRIFAAYSDHASSAAALKSFLSASLAQGQLRYVLLVGADTSDPYDHLGFGSISFVPTDYRDLTQVVRYSPTDETLVDRQNDGLGDVPIGRLPVRTPAELESVVAKLYEWEAAIGSGHPSALLAAGLSDGDRAIASVNEAYASSLAGWNTVLAQVDDSGSAAVRQEVLDGINAGAHLVSFVGHSSPGQWDFTPILKWQDAATLTNAGLPNLFTAWGCWNSYYVEPAIESLSARLLRQPDAGAAGAIGATTLTTEASHRLLGTLFFARVNAGAATVGEAFHGAKQDLATQGGAADAIYGMTLLGDPAMSLPHLD